MRNFSTVGDRSKRFFVYLFVFLLVFEPSLVYASETERNLSNSRQDSGRDQDVFDEFQNSDTSGPSEQKDSFLLIHQRREVWDSRSGRFRTRLLREDAPSEPLLMADFLNLSNLKTEILPGRQEFSLSKTGRVRGQENSIGIKARHVFVVPESEGHIVDAQFDREFLYVVTSKGRLYALYMPLARTGSFKHVLPLVKLFDLPPSMLEDAEHIKLKFAFRGHRPIDQLKLHPEATIPRDRLDEGQRETKLDQLPENFPFVASDLIVHKDKGGEILAVLDAGATLKKVHFGLQVAGQLAATAAGIPLLPELPQENQSLTQEAWSHVTGDPLLSQAFVNLGSRYVQLAASRQQAAGQIANPPLRDRFVIGEWNETYEFFESRAQEELSGTRRRRSHNTETSSDTDLILGEGAGEIASGTERVESLMEEIRDKTEKSSAKERRLRESIERGELDEYWKEYAEVGEVDPRPALINRIFNKKNLNRLAATLAIGGGVLAGGSQVATGDATRWALYLSQSVYEWLPDVVTTTPYNYYLLSSAVFLSFGVPILYVIGQITTYFLGGKRRGFDFKRSLGWLATVQFARLVKMVYITGIESILRNPSFIGMLQKSMNPFRTIRADSELGRRLGLDRNERPGLANPFDPQWRDSMERKREIIGKIYEQGLNARSAAVLLSVFLVSHEEDVDPASVFEAIKNGKLPIPQAEEEKKTFEKNWEESAKVLNEVFEGVAAAKGFPSIAEMDPQEFEDIYFQAKSTLQQAKADAESKSILKKMGSKWKGFRTFVTKRSIPFLASWGVEQSEILKNSLISQPIANESWRSTWIDFYFTTYQQAVIGGRADLSDPASLYADPNGTWLLGKANPDNVSDTVEQLAIHGIAVPSRNLIDFQSKTPLEEHRYTPLEVLNLERNTRHPGLLESSREWTKGVFSVSQISNFGDILWRSMYANRFKMIQSGILFSVVPRVAIAGQSVTDAFAAWSFVWLLAPFFAFVWPFVVVGNTKLESGTAEQYHQLKEAQALVNQGLRLNDQNLLKQGVQKLSELYSSLPEDAKAAVREAEEMLKNENFHVENWMAFEKHRDQVLDLWEALEIQKQDAADSEANQKRIAEAASKLKEAYEANVSTEMSPSELLAYSLRNPPFATTHHKGLLNAVTFLGGVVPSTLLASYLFANSYREDMNWAIAIPAAAVVGVGSFYGLRLFLTKAFKPIANFTRETAKAALRPRSSEISPELQRREDIQERRQELSQASHRRAQIIYPDSAQNYSESSSQGLCGKFAKSVARLLKRGS